MITNYSDLTISQYESICNILSDDSLDNPMKDVHILSILTGSSTQKILSLSVEDVNSLLSQALFLSKKPLLPCLPKVLSYGDFTFKLKFDDYCYGQYLDYHSFKGSLPALLRIILIPEGHVYNDGYEVDFSNLPADLGLAIIDSFVRGLVSRTRRTLKSSAFMARLTRRPALRNFLLAMDSSISQIVLPL